MTITDEERRRIARELRDPRGAAILPNLWKIITGETAPLMDRDGRHRLFDLLADLIESGPVRTCRYSPSETETWLDDDGTEHDTGEPSDECGTFACSECGYDMMYGDVGWFDLEPPHRPTFNYCPNCGAKVVVS